MRSRSTVKPLGPRARKPILPHGARPLRLCDTHVKRCGRNCGTRKGKPIPAELPVIEEVEEDEEDEEEVAADKVQPTDVDAIFATPSNSLCLQMFTEAEEEEEEAAKTTTVISASPEIDSPPSSSSEGTHTGLLESYDADIEDFKAESSPPAPVFAGVGTGLGLGLGILNVPQLTFQSTIIITIPESSAPRRPPLIRDSSTATSAFSSSRRPPLIRGTITTSEFSSSRRPTLIRAPFASSSFYTEKTSSVREPVKIKVTWKHRAKAIAKDTKLWFKMRVGSKAKARVC